MVIVFVRLPPVVFVATTVIVFSPSVSVTSALHILQSAAPSASTPFAVTDAMPDGSEAVPAMVMVGEWVVVPLAGEVVVRNGGESGDRVTVGSGAVYLRTIMSLK